MEADYVPIAVEVYSIHSAQAKAANLYGQEDTAPRCKARVSIHAIGSNLEQVKITIIALAGRSPLHQADPALVICVLRGSR
jgi:hypothetical protein